MESLLSAGYRVFTADEGREAVQRAGLDPPGVVLVDMRLRGVAHRDFIRDVSLGHDIPVVLIAGEGGQDVGHAFEVGADDCITDPLSRGEALARIKEALRRRSGRMGGGSPGTIRLGNMTVRHSERIATISGRRVQLPPVEFHLLWELASNAGCIMSQDTLIDRVWGHGYQAKYDLLRTTIKNLRRKLGDDAASPRYIVTVNKAGYGMKLQRR